RDGARRRGLRLRQLPRHRGALRPAVEGDRPEEARGDAPQDPARAVRAGAVRADLRLRLAERRGPARGRPGADADRPVPVVGPARGRQAQEELTAGLRVPPASARGRSQRGERPRRKSTRAWSPAIRNEISLPHRMKRAPAFTYFSMVGWS